MGSAYLIKYSFHNGCFLKVDLWCGGIAFLQNPDSGNIGGKALFV